MTGRKIPFSKKFRLDFDRKKDGFYFRGLLGLFSFHFIKNWDIYYIGVKVTQIGVGFIPFSVFEGSTIPCHNFYYRQKPFVQIRKRAA